MNNETEKVCYKLEKTIDILEILNAKFSHGTLFNLTLSIETHIIHGLTLSL